LFDQLGKQLGGLLKKTDDPLGTITPEQLKVVLKSIEGKYNSLRDDNRRLKLTLEEQRSAMSELETQLAQERAERDRILEQAAGAAGSSGADPEFASPAGEDVEGLRVAIEHLEGQVREARLAHDVAQREFEASRRELTRLAAEREIITTQAADHESEVTALRSRLTASEVLVATLTEEKGRLEAQAADARDRVAEAGAPELGDGAVAEAGEAARRVAELEGMIRLLETRLEQAEEARASALRLVESDGEKASLRAQLQEAVDERRRLEDRIVDLEAALGTADTSSGHAPDLRIAKDTPLDGGEREVALARSEAERETLEAGLADAKAEIDRLNARIAEAEAGGGERDGSRMQERLSALETEFATLSEAHDRLAATHAEMIGERDALIIERDNLVSERELIAQQLEDLPVREEAGERAVGDLAGRLHEAIERIDGLEDDLRDAKEAARIASLKLEAAANLRQEAQAEAQLAQEQATAAVSGQKAAEAEAQGLRDQVDDLRETLAVLRAEREAETAAAAAEQADVAARTAGEVAEMRQLLAMAEAARDSAKSEAEAAMERANQANITLQAAHAHSETLLKRSGDLDARLAQREEEMAVLRGIEADMDKLREERDSLVTALAEAETERDELRSLVEPLRAEQARLLDKTERLTNWQEQMSSKLSDLSLRTRRPTGEGGEEIADIKRTLAALAEQVERLSGSPAPVTRPTLQPSQPQQITAAPRSRPRPKPTQGDDPARKLDWLLGN
jgi:exonuclease SbcC